MLYHVSSIWVIKQFDVLEIVQESAMKYIVVYIDNSHHFGMIRAFLLPMRFLF